MIKVVLNLLSDVKDKQSLQILEQQFNDTFAASLQCFRDAHVKHAEEKAKLEEAERERKRIEREKAEEEERLRIAKEKAEEEERKKREEEERKRKEEQIKRENLERVEAAKKALAAQKAQEQQQKEAEKRIEEQKEADKRAEEKKQEEQKVVEQKEAEKSVEEQEEADSKEEKEEKEEEPQGNEDEENREIPENEKEIEDKPSNETQTTAQVQVSPAPLVIPLPKEVEKEKEKRDIAWGGEFPYWMDEKAWEQTENSILDENIIKNIHAKDSLKPSKEEWEKYFFWLKNIVGYPPDEVEMIRNQKIWQRNFGMRLCLFLHFIRIGIPVSKIAKKYFGTANHWENANRKAWEKASYVRLPSIENSIDWWCEDVNLPSHIDQYPSVLICHKFQTSDKEIDEFEDRFIILPILVNLGQSISDAFDNSNRLLSDLAIYNERYTPPRFQRLLNRVKLQELDVLINELKDSMVLVEDEKMLRKLEKAHDALYAATLRCFQEAHVLFAAEKSKLEEQERERKRLEKEKAEKEEQDRIDKERKEKEEQEAKEKAEREAAEKEEKDRIEKQEMEEKKQKMAEERKQKIQGLFSEEEKDEDKKTEESEEPEAPPLSKYEQERLELKEMIDAKPQHVTALLFDVFDTIERHTTERLILIAKKLELSEEEIIDMLQVNKKIAESNRRNMKRNRRNNARNDQLASSLEASGLI